MRYLTTLLILALGFLAGCGGTAEIKPQAEQKGTIDAAATQKAMEETMKQMQGKMPPQMMEHMKNMKSPQQMAEEAKKAGS